jgi:hypothetical protein
VISNALIDPKVQATLTAKACLAGVVLYFLEDDFGTPLVVASKWSLTRQLHSVAEVDTFLQRLGAPA